MNVFSRRSSLTALAVAALLAACAESTSAPNQLVKLRPLAKFDPRLELLDPGAPGLIVVCSAGGPASFTVSASPALGTLAGGGSFSANTDQCVTAWTAAPGDLTEVTIIVTQTSGDFGYIEATAVPETGLPRMTIDATNQRVRWDTNADHGGSATFFQQSPPPPPPPVDSKKLVVCKEGPAGETFTFTVVSDAPSGDVFPNGQEFTLQAGECKDAWEQDGPPVDPFVTVTEIGDAPIDSIRKELQDSAAVIYTGTREVTSRVGFYHGGVVTFFNAICTDETALNYGGAPPCRYPPPSVSCVSITAVQGVAITPVTLTASGGAGGPYTFSATGLPAGLSMSASGTISGTPTVSGTFSYTVTVTDKDGNTGTATCSVNVSPPPAVNCVSITAVQGKAITPVTLTASGGAGAPYTFTATGLPAGLVMSTGGTISGTPTVTGTFSYTVTVTDKDGNTASATCAVNVSPPPPQFCSYTPGGWGAPPSGGNVAMTLKNNFSKVYPSGVTVGTTGVSNRFYMKFTSASAIETFLPDGNTPGVLKKNYTNPLTTAAGTFGMHVLSLKLNIDFANAGLTKPGFSTLKVVSGPLAGLTTTQVLALANSALGGNTSVLAPYGITVASFTTILSSINESYDGCTVNTGYLQ